MAALLVSLSVMGLMMAMALPVWNVAAKREREAERRHQREAAPAAAAAARK